MTIEELSWFGCRALLPRDWEVVRHSTDPERGSLHVVDRRKQRLELSWTRADSEPDFERLLSDWTARERALDAGVRLREPDERRGLRVLELETGENRLTRAIGFDRASSRLIELLLIAETEPEMRESAAILESFSLSARPTR